MKIRAHLDTTSRKRHGYGSTPTNKGTLKTEGKRPWKGRKVKFKCASHQHVPLGSQWRNRLISMQRCSRTLTQRLVFYEQGHRDAPTWSRLKTEAIKWRKGERNRDAPNALRWKLALPRICWDILILSLLKLNLENPKLLPRQQRMSRETADKTCNKQMSLSCPQ